MAARQVGVAHAVRRNACGEIILSAARALGPQCQSIPVVFGHVNVLQARIRQHRAAESGSRVEISGHEHVFLRVHGQPGGGDGVAGGVCLSRPQWCASGIELGHKHLAVRWGGDGVWPERLGAAETPGHVTRAVRADVEARRSDPGKIPHPRHSAGGRDLSQEPIRERPSRRVSDGVRAELDGAGKSADHIGVARSVHTHAGGRGVVRRASVAEDPLDRASRVVFGHETVERAVDGAAIGDRDGVKLSGVERGPAHQVAHQEQIAPAVHGHGRGLIIPAAAAALDPLADTVGVEFHRHAVIPALTGDARNAELIGTLESAGPIDIPGGVHRYGQAAVTVDAAAALGQPCHVACAVQLGKYRVKRAQAVE